MKTIPLEPMAQYQRHMDALLADLSETGNLKSTPRANAVLHIGRAMRLVTDGGKK